MKKYFNYILLALGIAALVIMYIWLLHTPYFKELLNWSRQNLVTAVLVLVIIKILGIVIPPIPGGLITLGSIPFIGWQWAFFADIVGGLIGSTIAFYIGKHYGKPLLLKLFGEAAVKNIYKVKIKKHREIESVFMFKLFFGAAIADIISYSAGILGIQFKNFFISSAVHYVLIGIPAYFLVSGFFSTENIIINIIIVIIAIPLFIKFKNRYIE